MAINSCDYCNTGGYVPPEESDIYFSSTGVNGLSPGMFRINKDGSKFREILPNGLLYSPPTKTGIKKIAYLIDDPSGRRYIATCEIDGKNILYVPTEPATVPYQQPTISSDGKCISYILGTRELWLYKSITKQYRLSSRFALETFQAFSPDGTKIAFYEADDIETEFTIRVIDVTYDPPKEIMRKKFEDGLRLWKGLATISWTKDNQFIIYVNSVSPTIDIINITDINNPDYTESYEIAGIGAYMPSLSNSKDRLTFAGRDGNIWIRNLSKITPKYINLTESGNVSFNLYPKWSNDDNFILYNKYFKDDLNPLSSNLEIVKTDSTKKITVLCNNSFIGFWNR
ncbi:MAG: hypothetical protein N2319_10365 [Candidatus Kapabacteria bacterium]|nr:hypothetical protein [Candidatus Kapabacteria bacterium]